MKTLGFNTLKGSSNELLRWTKSNEVVVMTDNGKPVSLSIPFDDALLHEGLHIRLAAKLFEEGVSTLADAAKIANTPLEKFIQKLGAMGMTVVDYEADELDQELKVLGK